MEPMVQELYELIAEILDIEASVFRASHRRHFSECRCNYYLASALQGQEDGAQQGQEDSAQPPTLPGQKRISPHVDFTDFTLLAPDASASYPHLQVAGREGGPWKMVPFDARCLTLLLGEPMQKWSNDRWFAPLHCVDLPRTRQEMGPKYTLVRVSGFF
eukprot:Tamp_12812.p1 GENE.Tamp_12812~~Tamp_12812.p1  ORF type:complete len:159 (+),score=15.48 Tamp_12812:296-772(+)